MNLIKSLKNLPFNKINFLWIFISTGALVGFLPLCPGTWGSVEGIVFFWFMKNLALNYQIIMIIAIIILGTISSDFVSKILEDKDPEIVIIDEIAGIWLSVLGKTTFLEFILALIIFRIIDINKPFPIKKLETLKGGIGIMADDILAGIFTNIIVGFLFYLVKNWSLI